MTENEKLKYLQKFLGFKTQAEFADALGLKQGSLSDIYREKNGIGVSDSIKIKLSREFSISMEWFENDKGEVRIDNNQNIENTNHSNNINGVNGDIAISTNDFKNLIELQRGYQEMQNKLTDRLEVAQSQLSEAQKQVNTLLEMIKKER